MASEASPATPSEETAVIRQVWDAAAVKAWVELTRPGGRVISLDGLWSGQAHFRHYPAEIDMCLPLRRVRSLDPARNLWRRAGLVDVMAEELCWLDQVEQSRCPTTKGRSTRITPGISSKAPDPPADRPGRCPPQARDP
jgi:hypothetical protein